MKLKKSKHVVTIFLLEINHYANQVQSAIYCHTSTLRTWRVSTSFLAVPCYLSKIRLNHTS